MTAFVVDTNVAIVANGGKTTHADLACQLSCAEKLGSIVNQETVVIDDKGLIFAEYQGHLSFAGQPGMGDAFFKYVFDFQYRSSRVVRVPVTQSDDERRGYEELPENKFDPSDRKFLAVAVVSRAVILNATDSDWEEHGPLMDQLEVEVDQLCPQYARKRNGRE